MRTTGIGPISVAVVVAVIAASAGAAWVAPDVSREQAIDIARAEVSFEPESVEAELVESEDGEVWRVTFSGRLPGQPPELSEIVIVEVDASNGEIVSITRT
jgi:uncharacterized membrane protein YkoI